MNWNILVAKIKKINKDFVSNGEWTWKRKKFFINFLNSGGIPM